MKTIQQYLKSNMDWIVQCFMPPPTQYRSNDPTNSIKVLKEMLQKKKQRTKFNNLSMNKATDVAHNHPLWRLMSLFDAIHSPSGACHTRRRRRPKSGGKLSSTICGGGGVGVEKRSSSVIYIQKYYLFTRIQFYMQTFCINRRTFASHSNYR